MFSGSVARGEQPPAPAKAREAPISARNSRRLTPPIWAGCSALGSAGGFRLRHWTGKLFSCSTRQFLSMANRTVRQFERRLDVILRYELVTYCLLIHRWSPSHRKDFLPRPEKLFGMPMT